MSSFAHALKCEDVLLMDGAMGTELLRAGISPPLCLANLDDPDLVKNIHRAYVAAGAGVLLTNTFQTNPFLLRWLGLEEKGKDICQAGIHLARAGGAQWVLGSVGPCQNSPADWALMADWFAGVDGILLETWSDPAVFAALPFLGEIPVLVSFTFRTDADGIIRTVTGAVPEELALLAEKSGVTALGVNCGQEQSMDAMIDVIRRYRKSCKLPLFARPNAGTPLQTQQGWSYSREAMEMANKVPELIAAGAKMIGGCCGTTPAYITAFRRALLSSKFPKG